MASVPKTSVTVVLARVLWMMAGPAVLLLLAYTMTTSGGGWFSAASLSFLAILVAVIAARWHDPHDSEGQPTTPAGLRRYTTVAGLLGLAMWVLANAAGQPWWAG